VAEHDHDHDVHDHDHDVHEHAHDHDVHDHEHDHGGDPAGDEMRAMLAQQLLQMRPRDLLAQTAVMLANQAAIRLGLASPEHADREQAREAIDALAGIVDLLAPLSPPEEVEALRRDLAQLRMAFVQSAEAPAAPAAAATEPEDDPGEERPSIWTPGGEV
jgi:Domain of unknown function (DUF1844)